MKIIPVFLATLLFFLNGAHAGQRLIDCQVAKMIDEGVFEEGLSREEYPRVSLNFKNELSELNVGAMKTYEQKNGDIVRVFQTEHIISAYGKYSGEGGTVVKVEVSSQPNSTNKKWGKLFARQGLTRSWTYIALLICK